MSVTIVPRPLPTARLAWCIALVCLGATSALAVEPCGNLELKDGAVRTALTLPASTTISAETDACLARIAAELRQRGGLRSVTITVRANDEARADGSGDVVVKALLERLVAGGLSRSRISSVVAAGDGDVRISFAERAGAVGVGRIGAASGDVRVGPSVAAAVAVATGATLAAESFVSTGNAATALLELADGSQLRLKEHTVVHLQRLVLNEKLQRVVQLEVPSGAVDVVVAKGGAGSSFAIKTPFATAGVRGTVFRIVAVESPALPSSSTRLETIEGAVELGGSAGAVQVDHGFGSRVDRSGSPSKPQALPAAPVVIAPLKAEPTIPGLHWASVEDAAAYLVEMARDAEMVMDATSVEVANTTMTPTVGAGDWYWRVAARSADGFVGPSSQTFQVHVGP